MRLFRILFLAVLVLAGGPTLRGQRTLTPSTSGVLEGKVTDGKETTLAGMKVFALGANLRRETTTDRNGRYRLELPDGSYVIRAGTDCTQTFQQRDVKVSAGRVSTLNIIIPLYNAYAAHISIYQLLAAPDKYHDRPVTVSGFYRHGNELSSLFASRDDADYLISKNSLWVTFNSEGLRLEPNDSRPPLTLDDIGYFNGKYIMIQGVFNKEACGHFGVSSGEIRNVSRIVELRRFFDGQTEL